MHGKFYITTSVPYVNARPHIGFALELVQADAVARARRIRGDDVFFLTGTDDNSLKNVRAAEKAGMPTREFVERNAEAFRSLTKALTISNDDFIRTATDAHFRGAQKLWSACKPQDIYKKKYKGLYCVGCELFYTEAELVNGRCPEHDTVPESVEEENYFFRLSKYQQKLEQLISSNTYEVIPESRKNEVLSFIRMGLEDFSMSRSVERAKNWGVPVPNDPSQIMYVWFDALSNYITALGYAGDQRRYSNYWPADVHVIGKGIIRFHAVYWPAFLLSAGLPLPKRLFVHGYINVEGAKMSKSLGNVIDPFALVEKYGVDAVRYYLLKHVHAVEDSDFSEEQFQASYNADLANGLGNLVARVTAMIEKYYGGKLTLPVKTDTAFQKKVLDAVTLFNFREALSAVWKKITDDNRLIDKEKPWVLAEQDRKRLATVLLQLLADLYTISQILRPFMPGTAQKIEDAVTAPTIVKNPGLFDRITA